MIETERLKLIAANMTQFNNLSWGDEWFAESLGVTLAREWLRFPEAIEGGQKLLEANSQNLRWGTHFFIHKDDNKLIGLGGYKGAPGDAGTVEIGYSLSPDYENQGLATEAARGLINEAFSWAIVEMVDAHTLAEENASTRVLQKCGMTKIGEADDPDDGAIWHWRVTREEYEKDQQPAV